MKNQLFLFVFTLFAINLSAQPVDAIQVEVADLSEFEQNMILFGKTILTDTLVENR